MDSQRYRRIKALFERALELAPQQRLGFLEQECGGDASLRDDVESLLVSDSQAADFIERPALVPLSRLLPDAAADLSLAGARIGPYELLSEIGRGGMGIVYLASRADDQYQKLVAIKLVARSAENEAMLQRFRRERQILAGLDHPNIAQLLDGGATQDGRPYFVMEYVGGMPIDAYCEARQLEVPARLRLFLTVCAAVDYAHKNLVIHRDLKPSNVLVRADGTVKLLDFGVAKVLRPDGHVLDRTATSMRIMTPDYASPEQIKGGAVTTTSDVYLLGVLLYELLSGQRPFRIVRGSLQDLLGDREADPPSSRVDRRQAALLAGDLDAIVLKAIRKDPARRYSSVERLSEDIRRYLSARPVLARRQTPAYRAARFLKRNAVTAAAAACLLLVLLAATGVTVWQARLAARRNADLARELAAAYQALGDAVAAGASCTEAIRYYNSASALLQRLRAEGAGQPADSHVLAQLAKTIEGCSGARKPSDH